MSMVVPYWWDEMSASEAASNIFAASKSKEMKYALTALLLTSFAFAQTSPAAPQSSSSQQASSAQQSSSSQPAASSQQNSSSLSTDQANIRQAKAVLDRGIQALGGPTYLNWRYQTQEGRSYSFHHGEPNSLGIVFWRFREYPDKDRVELTKKRDVVDLFNGDKGYEITYKGVRNLNDKDELQPYLRRRHYSLDSVLREWLKQPGIALFYDGQTVAAEKETDQVTIMNAKNEGVTLYFDINTHLPVKETYSWRDPADQERNTEEEIYDNYRPIDGIMTPFDVTRNYNGEMAAQSFLMSASYGQPLSESLFDPHAKQDKKHR